MSASIEQQLDAMGVKLPEAAAPAANYMPFVIEGNLLHVSGQLPMGDAGLKYKGTLGDDASVEDGVAAAKLCAINILAQAKAALGDLEQITRIVKINGFVNSTGDFVDHPKIINGASDFLAEALGERGKHARCAVGMASLPFGAAVEIDALIAFK